MKRRTLLGATAAATLPRSFAIAQPAKVLRFVPQANLTLLDPCTSELVDVSGASTITIAETVDRNGQTKTAVSVTTKGTGIGQVTANSYPFSENQNFTVKVAVIGEAFDSAFSDKLSLKGPGSTDNFVVRAFLPQLELLESHADVFITHHGMNSTTESILAGVPMVSLPGAGDQITNAEIATANGAAVAYWDLRDPFATVTAETLGRAVDEALHDPAHRAVCGRLAETMAAAGGPARAAGLVVALGARTAGR